MTLPPLKPGDCFAVQCPSVFGRMISAVEKRDPEADPKYSHAGLILTPAGKTIEALWTVRYGNLTDYAGCAVLVGRYKKMDRSRFLAGLDHADAHLNERYPAGRLLLDLFGLGRFVHSEKVVCSELCAEFLAYATELKEFKPWFGWTPAQLADVFERWKDFEVVFKGTLKGAKNEKS